MTPSILALDVAGTPRKWINAEAAICYHAKSLVVWSLGEDVILYRGGISRMTGNQSIITSPSIIAIKGTDFNPTKFAKISLNNKALFARDRNMCAYCGQMHEGLRLSRDHIIPISRGGQNKWMNCVTACKRCNTLKNDRTLDEAGMELLYLPYIPVHNEYLILQNRNCLADQMDYLMAGLPKHSRVFEMMKDRKAA